MRQSRQFKSPKAAMMWSFLFPGLGQLYNKDFLIGIVLLLSELVINLNANLNLALVNSFKGDLYSSHQVIDYSWALFYPSIYGYSIWQAYNSAKANNNKLLGITANRTYYSGFFLAMVLGMDFGLFWHDSPFINSYSAIRLLDYPVFNGIFLGLLFGMAGHLIEKMVCRKVKAEIYH